MVVSCDVCKVVALVVNCFAAVSEAFCLHVGRRRSQRQSQWDLHPGQPWGAKLAICRCGFNLLWLFLLFCSVLVLFSSSLALVREKKVNLADDWLMTHSVLGP